MRLKLFLLIISAFVFIQPKIISQESEQIISKIKAFHWQGQTFLQWEEKESKEWITFNVYRSDNPINKIDDVSVECLARRIIPRSGRSFYVLKRTAFKRPLPCNEKRYTVVGRKNADIKMSGLPLPDKKGKTSITGGIFVHTVTKNGKSYYAVTYTPYMKKEDKKLVSGKNTLKLPVTEKKGQSQPYLIDSKGVIPNSPADGKTPFKIYVYAIGGTVDMTSPVQFKLENYRTYLLWMPKEFGWREGLPTIFFMKTNKNKYGNWLELQPDDSNFAFMGFANSWWFGYNEQILNPDKMKDGIVKLYSQKKLRYIINWIFDQYPNLDRTTTEIMGSSMGGTGSLLFGLRNPDLIAAVNAGVPAGNLPKLPAAKNTLQDLFGSLDVVIKTENGENIWEELNNTWYVKNNKNKDLPFVKVSNTRYDGWMLWPYSPPFYKAFDECGHAYAAWWNPAGHNGSSRFDISTFKDYLDLNKVRTNASQPGITNCSLNDDCGNGDIENGTRFGGMNYCVNWKVLKDEAREYSILFKAMPALGRNFWKKISFSFTPRRLQKFKIKPEDKVLFKILLNGRKVLEQGSVKADENGLIKVNVSAKNNRGTLTVILKK